MDASAFFKHPGAEVRGQIRCGRISSSDAKAHTAQVEFFEQEGFVSHDLQIVVTRPGDYSVYKEKTLVLCLLIDGIQGFGFVLGALYSESDGDQPPLDDENARSIAGDDVRLSDPESDDEIAVESKVQSLYNKLHKWAKAINDTIMGPRIPEPGNGANSAFQIALQQAIQPPAPPEFQNPLPDYESVGFSKVKAGKKDA